MDFKSANCDSIPLYGGRKAPLRLDVIIVGCGIGGLTTAFCLGQAGHNVTVVEASSSLGEVGAGIQISPNVTRLLFRWGLGPKLAKYVVAPQGISFRRYATGELVGRTLWGDKMLREHGAPYYHVHRADYHQLIYELAKPWMNLRLNSKVVDVDPSTPSITLQSGEKITADFIIGADGIKSTLREVVVGNEERPMPTGDAAYRAVIPTGPMIQDPELKHLVDEAEMVVWMGPTKHIVGYCLRAKKEYNLVMLHPDEDTGGSVGARESWTAEASTKQMRSDFVGWEPRIQKLLGMVESTLNWKLMDRAPLSRWVHEKGRIALIGDACHPMLPYRAQGAAIATEDAITLGVLFSHVFDRSQIGPMLQAYQQLRHARATATQLDSRACQSIYHLQDGPEQEERDNMMRRTLMTEEERLAKPAADSDLWANQKKNQAQYSFDAEAVAEDWWHQIGRHEIGARPKSPPTSFESYPLWFPRTRLNYLTSSIAGLVVLGAVRSFYISFWA
jgi:salicylate hydroxylase